VFYYFFSFLFDFLSSFIFSFLSFLFYTYFFAHVILSLTYSNLLGNKKGLVVVVVVVDLLKIERVLDDYKTVLHVTVNKPLEGLVDIISISG
jgi:hypothetical protein